MSAAVVVMVIKPDGSSEVMRAEYDDSSKLTELVEAVTKLFGPGS